MTYMLFCTVLCLVISKGIFRECFLWVDILKRCYLNVQLQLQLHLDVLCKWSNTHDYFINTYDYLWIFMSSMRFCVVKVVTSAGAIVNAGLPTSSISELEKRVSELEISRESLLEKNGLQEQELNRIRTQLGSIREERDKFRRRASTPALWQGRFLPFKIYALGALGNVFQMELDWSEIIIIIIYVIVILFKFQISCMGHSVV